MPGYVNPFMQNAMPPTGNYMMNTGYAPAVVPMAQQSYASAPMVSNVLGWQVDGEVGAKAFNIPAGATGPFALWDLNDNVIYMRTYNAAGMPNPLLKYRYIQEEIPQALPMGQSGAEGMIDTSQFVTKDDFNTLRQEIQQLSSAIQNRNMSNTSQNQNGSNNRSNGNQGR